MAEPLCGQRPNPCKGCPDKVPACSDKCRKDAFLKWKAEQATIRENRRKYNETTIQKNRRKGK